VSLGRALASRAGRYEGMGAMRRLLLVLMVLALAAVGIAGRPEGDLRAASGLYQEGDMLCADTLATFAGGTGRFTNAPGSALEKGCWPASNVGPETQCMIIKSAGRLAFDASNRRG
jgi:hypothetical protein